MLQFGKHLRVRAAVHAFERAGSNYADTGQSGVRGSQRKTLACQDEDVSSNREWARGAETGGRDPAWFLRDVVPKLDAFTLAKIAKATGFSLAACSRIRSGARVPHPRLPEPYCLSNQASSCYVFGIRPLCGPANDGPCKRRQHG